MPTKECNICKRNLPHSKFRPVRNKLKGGGFSPGIAPYCKRCERVQQLERKFKDRFNMTPDDYYRMEAGQDGKCAICGTSVDDIMDDTRNLDARLCIDHDHATGKVRGLLCRSCNVALGNLRDDPQLFKNAIRYLNDHS